ncbi:UNKNOWN [Stylonychia lemnae]|uniref:Uncharacterized protein n=1 Tax=Stylonychia lemnae TaxID=5949 RepID=A0A078AAY7_STYLE|nr:UNKNOWN [Stylonychia lemnae]|eukprot:CDW79420.1 UNKNOWN [Stylonychia lemnae]
MKSPQIQQLQSISRKDISKFFQENKFARYLIYGVIAVKAYTIYDKMKQIVAISNVYDQILEDERRNFRNQFKNQDMVQDLITRRILMENQFNDDENDLQQGVKYNPDYRKSNF